MKKNLIFTVAFVLGLGFQQLSHAGSLPFLLLKSVVVNGLSNTILKNYNTGGPVKAQLITDNVNKIFVYIIIPGSSSSCITSIASVNSRLSNSSSASLDIGTKRTAIYLGRSSNGYPIYRMYADKCTEH